MREIIVVLFILFSFISACEKHSDCNVCGFYDYMHFERQGGGQIDFNIYLTGDTNTLAVKVLKYNFNDTTTKFVLSNNIENYDVFSAFYKAINNQIEIKGDFHQSTDTVGTWAYIYFVVNEKETEVTNTELRNKLLYFEQLVRDKIE
jgi:serine/threonine protein phosphatase PrpC